MCSVNHQRTGGPHLQHGLGFRVGCTSCGFSLSVSVPKQRLPHPGTTGTTAKRGSHATANDISVPAAGTTGTAATCTAAGNRGTPPAADGTATVLLERSSRVASGSTTGHAQRPTGPPGRHGQWTWDPGSSPTLIFDAVQRRETASLSRRRRVCCAPDATCATFDSGEGHVKASAGGCASAICSTSKCWDAEATCVAHT